MFAGTHWLHEIISILMRGKLEYNTTPIFKYFLEFMPDFKGLNCGEPKLYSTHLRKEFLPESALTKVKCTVKHIVV